MEALIKRLGEQSEQFAQRMRTQSDEATAELWKVANPFLPEKEDKEEAEKADPPKE